VECEYLLNKSWEVVWLHYFRFGQKWINYRDHDR